jgi:hypothetical protein
MASYLLGDEGFLRARTALFLQLLHVVSHRIEQVVGELPVTLPSVAQQIEMDLVRLEVAQVVGGIVARPQAMIGSRFRAFLGSSQPKIPD